MAWDAYMLPVIGEVGKLRRAMQTSDILIRRHRYRETIGKQAFAVVCTLMLWRMLVSHIPLKNQNPTINIPPMHVITLLVTFPLSSGAGQFYINSVDVGYQWPRERISGVASA
jgi:hypothetical protein